jgi:hypothetical protein
MPVPTILNRAEREILSSLVYHDGFKVLLKLMETRTKMATVEMLNIKPDDPERLVKLSAMQAVAFAMDKFCSELSADVNWNIAMLQVPDEDAEEAAVGQETN